jgi:type I restriction enzyme M protein
VTDSQIQEPDTDEDQGVDLGDLLLEVLPGDGSTIGNLSAREALSQEAERQVGNTAK